MDLAMKNNYNLAPRIGFEPISSALTVRRCHQLSYRGISMSLVGSGGIEPPTS